MGRQERNRMKFNLLARFWGSLSAPGLILGTLFFTMALTPTLIPRTFVTQGVLSGFGFAAGYGIGVLLNWLWRYMELPRPGPRVSHPLTWLVLAACVGTAIAFLARTADWQNTIRSLMGLDPLATGHPFRVSAIALVTFLAVLVLARLFRLVSRLVSRRIGRVVPRRVANVIGVAFAVLLAWGLGSNLLGRAVLQALDSSFEQLDAFIEPTIAPPASALRTGSAQSLLGWEALGRMGRAFVGAGPQTSDIGAFTDGQAREPIRIYVGMRAAETATERAQIALAEMKRVGAFDRAALVVITPTGTGWVDPAAIDGLEYLLHGDVASVAMQYSYLNSPLSLLVQPDYGLDSARALFVAVYEHWRSLPRDRRPELYLYGLSLGALNSERSAALFEMIDDPVNGALWSGPPFESEIWRRITDSRNPGSPAWLPLFRDGSFVRFMNQHGVAPGTGTAWGPMRIVYLQYASDAITFFDYRDLYRRPAWMDAPRGPDVSPELAWYPVITMLQLALDMAMATTTPIGYGHVYAPAHYIEAWASLVGDRGWTRGEIERLKQHLAPPAP